MNGDNIETYHPSDRLARLFAHSTFARFFDFVARRREKQAREHYRDERAHAELCGIDDVIDMGGEG